jgi:hypothetical protein
MALYINTEKNSLVFTEEDFEMNKNYLPLIVAALRDLNPEKPIHFGIALEKTPMVFVLYQNKIIKESNVDLRLYHKDRSEKLVAALRGFGIKYYPFRKFPDAKSFEN